MASSVEDKEKMRALVGNPSALPPQIANGDQYCGVRIFVCLLMIFPRENAPDNILDLPPSP